MQRWEPDPVASKQKRTAVCAESEHPSQGVLVGDVWYEADDNSEGRQAPAGPSSRDDRGVRINYL